MCILLHLLISMYLMHINKVICKKLCIIDFIIQAMCMCLKLIKDFLALLYTLTDHSI